MKEKRLDLGLLAEEGDRVLVFVRLGNSSHSISSTIDCDLWIS